MKTITFLLPEYLLPYLMYDEIGELSLDEQQMIDSFLKAKSVGTILSCDEETRNFVRYHDLASKGWLACDCIEMVFPVLT